MSKYIDADKLNAKIKGLNLVTKTYEEQVAFNNALSMVVEIIDSLQQEQTEVDLEQEVISYFQGMWPGIDANTTMSFTPPAIMRLVKHFYGLGKEQNPKVMQEMSDNVDKLKAISTPAEEDWFEIDKEWEKEDKDDAMTEQGFRIIDDGIWISRSELEKMKRNYFGSALEAMDVKKEDTYRHAYFAGQNNLCLDLLIRIDGCKRPLTE